jgi:hypothetical protein
MFLLTRNYLNESQFCAITTSVGRAVKFARQYLSKEQRQFCAYEIRRVQINWAEDWAERSMIRFEGPVQRRPLLVIKKTDAAADAVSLFFPVTGLCVVHKFATPLQ